MSSAFSNEMQANPEHIAISKSKGVKIDWEDGHRSEYTLAYLRDECPCASCTGAHGTEPQKTNFSAMQSPGNPFPMFKAAPKMVTVEPVGSYAFRVEWNDGHKTGIYSYDHLRKICPCPECRSKTE